uniref:Uncharacterized protein n=1 Tax=Anguilla anguilla TaxID=7936 RepID=A0A0E9WZ07_ANGAN
MMSFCWIGFFLCYRICLRNLEMSNIQYNVQHLCFSIIFTHYSLDNLPFHIFLSLSKEMQYIVL